MRRAGILASLALPLALAACGGPEDETAREGAAGPRPPVLGQGTRPAGPSPEQLATLEDRDCRVVAEAYVRAIERRDFAFAARFWDDPVIDQARLTALFDDYVTPRITMGNLQEEGATGTVFCTVPGVLVDASDPRIQPLPGQLVLRRLNGVPAAGEGQARWTLRSSSFIEPMERSRTGDPG